MRSAKAALGIALFAGFLCAWAGIAAAGKPHNRNGFFIGFGVGAGSAGWDWGSETLGGDESTGGGAGNFRIGGAIRNDITVGLESSGWVREEDNATVSLSVATFGVTFFPGNMGLYARGGFGFGSANSETEIGDLTLSTTDTGFAFLLATGYEFRLSDKFALGPQVEFAYLGLDGEIIDTAHVVNGSLQFNWYW